MKTDPSKDKDCTFKAGKEPKSVRNSISVSVFCEEQTLS